MARLEQQRGVNLGTLTAPLAKRLQQLEADLTKQDRIADAKSARAYRETVAPIGEAGPASSPLAAASSSLTRAKEEAWTDVLAQVDVAKHALAGEWEMKNGHLHSGRSEWPMCELPVDYDGGNYDLKLQVERVAGASIGFFFAFRKDNSGGTVVFDYFNGGQGDRYNQMKVAGLEHLNGVMAWDGNGTQVARPQWIVPGKKYTILIQVRDEGVAVQLDDEEVIRWTGDWFQMQQRGSFHNSTNSRRVFGLGAFQCEIEVSSAEFRSVKGADGKKLPAAKGGKPT